MILNNADWLVSFSDYQQVWENQPVYLLTQCLFLFGGLCTLKHALSNGGRWPSLWFIVTLNGILLELIPTFVPNIKYYWYSQGPIMLFDKTLPLGMVFFCQKTDVTLIFECIGVKILEACLFPCYMIGGGSPSPIIHSTKVDHHNYTDPALYYTSVMSASHLQLSSLHESLAAAILALLINLPNDLVGLKYLQWVWHDSDPKIEERNFSVPWNSYIFHFLFAIVQCSLFTTFYGGGREREDYPFRKKRLQESSNWKLVILNVTLSVPVLFITFSIFHFVLRDFLMISIQVIFLLMFSLAVSLVWNACVCDARREKYFKRGNSTSKLSQKYIISYLFLHYVFYCVTPLLFAPEEGRSIGAYQPIGPCNVIEPVHTFLAKVLKRKKYLCLENYSQNYFDFHCVPKFAPSNKEIISYYTLCGTVFQNKTEFIGILVGIGLIAFCVFRTIFHSEADPAVKNDKERKRA